MSKNIKSVALFYHEGSSDKVYNVQLVEESAGSCTVNFQYGRRGATLQHADRRQPGRVRA